MYVAELDAAFTAEGIVYERRLIDEAGRMPKNLALLDGSTHPWRSTGAFLDALDPGLHAKLAPA
ncbi:hypothetical protein LBMAG42_32780 [Deltaproteobacteria bacterium]|nr:hypothetical protein LBMAG42_32780 [Deltaproteobacteria bacterium]